ncbi:MAG: hypothetical protein LBI74_00325 [Synergistaceae bacterium]|jgi:hypothetical protein|nr:hypothetical protein [Synergistaceae bacterium]
MLDNGWIVMSRDDSFWPIQAFGSANVNDFNNIINTNLDLGIPVCVGFHFIDVIVRGSAKAPIASYPRGIAGDAFHHELGDRQSVIEPGTVSRISLRSGA